MDIKEEHRRLLLALGLAEEDFECFDGNHVRYEYDEQKGVRLYDPYYKTSYKEYIDVDGWSAWSGEKDTFMSDILKGLSEEVRPKEGVPTDQHQTEITEALRKKFGRKTESDPA